VHGSAEQRYDVRAPITHSAILLIFRLILIFCRRFFD